MTDRVRVLTVVLDSDVRTDDVEPLCEAIRHLRGVVAVEHGPPVDGSDVLAREVAKSELRGQLIELLAPDWARVARGREA